MYKLSFKNKQIKGTLTSKFVPRAMPKEVNLSQPFASYNIDPFNSIVLRNNQKCVDEFCGKFTGCHVHNQKKWCTKLFHRKCQQILHYIALLFCQTYCWTLTFYLLSAWKKFILDTRTSDLLASDWLINDGNEWAL